MCYNEHVSGLEGQKQFLHPVLYNSVCVWGGGCGCVWKKQNIITTESFGTLPTNELI